MTNLQYAILRQVAGYAYDARVIAETTFPVYIVVHEQLIRDGYITVETHGGQAASVLTAKGRDALHVETAVRRDAV